MGHDGDSMFGEAPISEKNWTLYRESVQCVIRIFEEEKASYATIDHISRVKGIFSSVFKVTSDGRGQSDWRAKRTLLGEPSEALCKVCADWLAGLRKRVQRGEDLRGYLEHVDGREVLIKLKRVSERLQSDAWNSQEGLPE